MQVAGLTPTGSNVVLDWNLDQNQCRMKLTSNLGQQHALEILKDFCVLLNAREPLLGTGNSIRTNAHVIGAMNRELEKATPLAGCVGFRTGMFGARLVPQSLDT
jgi:hypothetical protein